MGKSVCHPHVTPLREAGDIPDLPSQGTGGGPVAARVGGHSAPLASLQSAGLGMEEERVGVEQISATGHLSPKYSAARSSPAAPNEVSLGSSGSPTGYYGPLKTVKPEMSAESSCVVMAEVWGASRSSGDWFARCPPSVTAVLPPGQGVGTGPSLCAL